MPRPKRTKIATRVAPTRVAKPSEPAAQPPKAKKTPTVVENFSEDSDGLVVKSKRVRSTRRMQDADFTMTGALPAQEEQEVEGVREETEAVTTQINARTPSSNASKNRRPSGRRSQAQEQETSPQENRLPSPTGFDAPGQDEESSLMDPSLLTFGSLDSDSPAHGTRPPSAIKVGGTPGHETSILALTNFRRRARQPSLLRMVQPTTDVEDNDLDNLDDLDDLDDDLNDFHPDDESTPLHVRKFDTVAQLKEHPHDTSALSSASSGSRGKKRKLSSPVIQVPRSSPPTEPASETGVVEEVDSQRSSSPSLPDGVGQTQEEVDVQEPTNAVPMSDTMAPPRSSSPPIDDEGHSSGQPRRKSGRGGRDATAEADEGRTRPTKPTRKQTSKPQTISTAKLQALLPRRRTRMARERDEYDMHTSDDVQPIDSDQDELQMPAPRARIIPASQAKPKNSRTAKKASIPAQSKKKSTRTYARRTSSDKENGSTRATNEDEEAPSEPTETSILAPSSRLAAIAKKFEDVDAWEMEFESVDVGGGGSSPWR